MENTIKTPNQIDSHKLDMTVEGDIQKVERRERVMKIVRLVLIYMFLCFMALIIIFPFYWMIISSFKDIEEYNLAIPTFWPRVWHFENYKEAISTANLANTFRNTLIVGITSTLLSLIITILAAFAFSRLEFKGRDLLFTLLLATMMIPGEMFTITNYATVTHLGWKESYTVLIIPFLVSVFYIFLLRQNFKQISNDLYLAAKVDGTSDFKYLIKVMIPLSMPTIISITILKMMGAWNSYVWPRLVANTEDYQLITNGLRGASFTIAGSDMTNYPVQMAAVTIVSVPLFLVFVLLRKYIIRGVSRSGSKG